MTHLMTNKQTHKRIQKFKKHLKINKIGGSDNNYEETKARKKDKDTFDLKVKVHCCSYYIYEYIHSKYV